jgi:hypothetical protein
MRAPLLFMLPAVAATALVLSCGETEEDLPDGAELSLTPEVTTAATPAASPEPTPGPIPSDWKEYRDEGLGFSLRYPPDLEFRDLTGPIPMRGQRGLDFRSPADPGRAISISIVDHPEGQAIEDWAHEFICTRDNQREGTAGGLRAIFCQREGIEGRPSSALITDYRGKILLLGASFDISSTEFGWVVESLSLPAVEG